VRILTPETLDEALAMLADEPDAAPIAGGTDALVNWPARIDDHERTWLDLAGVAELRRITWDRDALVLGAMTTFWDVIQDERIGRELPLLSAAARRIGAIQIQARGTWAGNIANASPAADGVVVLMAYGASVEVAGEAGRSGAETIDLDRFYTGYRQTLLGRGRLITAIRVPLVDRDIALFEKVGPRRAQAISKLALAVTHGDCWRVVAGAMAPTVTRCPSIERMLDDEHPVNRPGDFLPAIDADLSPIDDIRSSAEYRRIVMGRVLYHALRERVSFVH
jgi:CO/xanthine dehydrogenase FAD-binding subunit